MKKRNSKFRALAIFVIIFGIIVIINTVVYFATKNVDNFNSANAVSRTKNDVYNCLMLGRDSAAGLCDVMVLLSINMENGDINIMQIPRDTYLNYSDSSYKKINGIYNALGSASAVADAVSDALGIDIDYYLCLTLENVAKIVDNLSGIEIDLPFDMDYEDSSQNLSIHLKAGKQTLGGKESLGFLRYRSGYVTGDLGRIDAQKLFLNAFINRLATITNPFSAYNFCKLICNTSETNLKQQDIIAIGLRYAKAKNHNVFYMTAPGQAIQSSQSGAWYYVLSSSSVNEILNKCFASKENFDKQNKFVDKNDKSFYDIYNKYCEVKIYTAEDIENNLININ